MQTLTAKGFHIELIDSFACFGNQFGEESAHFSLDRLLHSDIKGKATKCDIDFIVVVGSMHHKNETDLAVTIVNYQEADKSETLHIHAEGKVGGFLPAPLPYLSLFYFRSTPDTKGSAIDALAKTIINKIGVENDDPPMRILYLQSSNLTAIARQHLQPADQFDNTGDDNEMSRYNPFSFYVHMNKEAAEEGNPVLHNPIGQVMFLMMSIMAAPTAFALDTVFGRPDQATSEDVKTVTAEEESAMADASEAINRHNWEAGYRSLEGCLHSKNAKVRGFFIHQIKAHPELKDAARQTFSESALRQSKSLHGDSALNIERRRLAIFEKITAQEDMAYASINMHKVFPNYQHITNRKLRVEVGAYCPNADLGYADAQKRIADIYFYGLYNVKQDFRQAYIWYSLAANGGDSEAKVRLGLVTSKFSSAELIEATHFLEQWEPGQCKKDLFRNNLGLMPHVNNGS